MAVSTPPRRCDTCSAPSSSIRTAPSITCTSLGGERGDPGAARSRDGYWQRGIVSLRESAVKDAMTDLKHALIWHVTYARSSAGALESVAEAGGAQRILEAGGRAFPPHREDSVRRQRLRCARRRPRYPPSRADGKGHACLPGVLVSSPSRRHSSPAGGRSRTIGKRCLRASRPARRPRRAPRR